MGKSERFELFRVIGSGSVQELICQTILLPELAEEIKEIRKTVIIDNCRVIFDKVIIDGRLRKDIMFKAADAGFPQPGSVRGCGGIVSTIAGSVEDVDVDIAFTALIPVPGACPDDQCVVLEAFVEGENEEAANIQASGAFNALIDKSVIFLCVKVVRDTITSLDHDHDDEDYSGHDDHKGKHAKRKHKKRKVKKEELCDDRGRASLCPKRRSTGAHPTGRIPAPRPGNQPGTWIGPTLVFEGILNPGIPSTAALANVIVNQGGTQIQITGRGNRT